MATSDIASGASTGATIGSGFGPWGTLAGGIIGGAAGGILGRSRGKKTTIQKQQQQLIDELLGSLKGEGPYSDLFAASQEDFEKGFAEPARARFRNVTAPQIQQQYIAGGQQRSTGLQDTLARAGVDMDSLINQHLLQYQQGKEKNQSKAIANILGQGEGPESKQGIGSAALQGVGGYASTPEFGKSIGDILSGFGQNKSQGISRDPNDLSDILRPPSKGYERGEPVYNPYTGIQEYQ